MLNRVQIDNGPEPEPTPDPKPAPTGDPIVMPFTVEDNAGTPEVLAASILAAAMDRQTAAIERQTRLRFLIASDTNAWTATEVQTVATNLGWQLNL